MTNHWIDIKNAKLHLVCGSNGAENHPVVMQWINQSIAASGAIVMVADPRKTRMAGIAEARGGKFIRIRPGTNGAFMMGLTNYAIQNGRADLTYLGETLKTRTFVADNGTTVTVSGRAVANPETPTQTQGGADVVIGGWPKWTDASFKLNAGRTDYVRGPVTGIPSGAANVISNMPVVLSNWQTNPDSVWSVLKSQAATYSASAVADICDIPGGAIAFEAFANIVTDPANRPVNIQYAMGGTQHSHASQDLRAYCILQLVLGNLGKLGGGINALRGIHNVQGSTDQGTLYDLLPGYSSVPAVGTSYGAYQNGQFGTVSGVAAPYWTTGLQQVGFRNMMHWYFRQTANPSGGAAEYSATDNANFDLLPKGVGQNHREMFEKMQSSYAGADKTNILVAFGQNPAVTEPNVGLIKSGLKELYMLVVMDMFGSETANCDRKGGGHTYFLPAASFVEEEGSTTNSGRWIQWRFKQINPQGGSKSDTEILLSLAKALDNAGAFNHIPIPTKPDGSDFASRYEGLYGDQYGWTGVGVFDAPTVATNVFKQMCSDRTGSDEYGALWIYKGAWGAPSTNKAQSRVKESGVYPLNKGIHTGWGWAWLLNRRVFYNNGGTVANGDVPDNFVPPDKVARIYCHTVAPSPNLMPYSNTYRAYSTIANAAIPKHFEPYETKRFDLVRQYGRQGDPPTNPYATVETTLSASGLISATSAQVASSVGFAVGDNLTINPGGLNQENIKVLLIVGNDIKLDPAVSPVGLTKDHPTGEFVRKDLTSTYPLILTTFRQTEHFQGGPMSRNVKWLCELVPDPIIEINSADAYTSPNIKTGDNVYIDTIRASNIGPFKAVVGTGVEENQKVRQGYVAVPFHWGRVFLGVPALKEGASANDVTIDALDPNSKIQETKVCLCNIHK